jgi:hypothetical protein
VDEPTAWLLQAEADWQAAERFKADEVGTGRCHALSKWQQTVEKTIKALVSALHDAGILGTGVRPTHDVARYVDALIRLPRPVRRQVIQRKLHGLLDQNTRTGISDLGNLAPQYPPQRNTEYPFQDERGQWTYPAAEGVFHQDEVQRFRALAYRVLEGARRIVSTLRRRPSP